jgi:hypothetical protein
MKVTKKQMLVDYMQAAGNPGFTYTEVIKTLLKFRFGDNFQYSSEYRGYYSCAISGINNYLVNGAGRVGLYKKDGKYYAKYFTKQERKVRALKLLKRRMDYQTRWNYYGHPVFEETLIRMVTRFTKNYNRSIKMIENDSY